MSNLNIIQAFEDPKIFGSLIKDQSTFASWKVALKVIFGLPLDSKERKIYGEFTGREKSSKNAFKEIFLIIGRRGGKSFISAVIAVFLAVFKDWKEHLRPGETGYIMCLASDRKQASVVLGYIRAILRLPIFKKMIVNETKEEIELNNQITIAVHTCSYRSLRGFTVVAAICDEIAFWRVEGANPAKEVLTALRPSLATVPDSILLALSTPYSRSGPLYDSFKDKYGQDDPDVLVWKAPTKLMNPTIQDRIINKALEEDPSAARAEWLAEFRDDIESFLPTEIIEDAIVRGRHGLLRMDGNYYEGFVDPSGGRADSFTMAVGHRDEENNKIIVDWIEERRPPFKPQNVINEFSEILKSYDIYRVTGDRYAAEFVSTAFRDAGISFESAALDKSQIYAEFGLAMFQGVVELLDNRRLCDQLKGLERRTRSGGHDKIDHFPGSHDDVANSAAGVCWLCRKPAVIPKIWRA